MNKIRVLHMFNIMNRGGAETFMMNVYKKIDRKNIQFDFLCTSTNEGAYDKEIKKLGGNIFYLPQNRKRPISSFISLVLFLKKEGPFDVIHIPLMFYSGIVAMAAKIAGVNNIIVHSHNAGDKNSDKLIRKAYCKFMRMLINKIADYKLACGYEAGKFLFDKMDNVIIINNGVDIEKLQKVNEKNNKEIINKLNLKDEFIIGNIARFVPEKNHKFFIELGRYIKDNSLNIRIILVGDGLLKNNIEEEVEKNKLNNIISFMGVRDDIPDLLHVFDVLVMPSIYEGFPVTIIESLAAGVPCVLSNNIDKKVAIIKKMVDFVDLDNNISEWYKKIINMSSCNISYEEIKSLLRKKKFDIESSVKILEKIYINNREVNCGKNQKKHKEF